jgi:hypothetical protein
LRLHEPPPPATRRQGEPRFHVWEATHHELDDTSGIRAPDIAEAVEEPKGLAVLAKNHRAEPAHTGGHSR